MSKQLKKQKHILLDSRASEEAGGLCPPWLVVGDTQGKESFNGVGIVYDKI